MKNNQTRLLNNLLHVGQELINVAHECRLCLGKNFYMIFTCLWRTNHSTVSLNIHQNQR
jgi:hypothetical protein